MSVRVCVCRTNDPQAAVVAESVEQFITAMDTLKLNLRAVDQICPVLLALMNSMDKITALPPSYGPREKIRVSVSCTARGLGWRREPALHYQCTCAAFIVCSLCVCVCVCECVCVLRIALAGV